MKQQLAFAALNAATYLAFALGFRDWKQGLPSAVIALGYLVAAVCVWISDRRISIAVTP